MPRENMLVVDDEEDILELLRYNLAKNGFNVTTATSGEDALKTTKTKTFDIILLDLMLPGIDGLDVCKELKKNQSTSSIPIIMLTAKGEEADIVAGLELGADDYVTKPFSPRVLVSRIKAVLRRRGKVVTDENAPLRYDEMEIDPGRFKVFVKGSLVELTHTEFSILHFLAKKPGWVFTRYQIIDAIKGLDYPVTDRSVDVQVVGLRKKLGEYGDYIETVRGVGYRFREL
ncbi:MAG TPA: response regulator [Caldisericia bacterium]|jgi:two-component system phosphate regulon response regulator PhoB|nr:MAG: Alkaline phosphatase synthesis transcriptional regulatory protein PhoP [bacterium ADurb.Bin132]HNW31527.1 response regulator [Caldisericia bacterium]HNY61651.1 response regulator [Caldisericia bacterium]HOC79502.1 response regulator [Caldisericia bacterium]HOG70652.1 response regulator [Caldisericia bacterium]